MPRDFSRTRRVEEQLRRELDDLIRHEVKEPGLGMLSLSDAKVSPDLSHARIFVSFLDDDPQIVRDSMEILQASAGRLRGLLGRRMRIRVVPQLEFILDDLIRKGMAMSDLIDKAVNDDRRKADHFGTETTSENHEEEDPGHG